MIYNEVKIMSKLFILLFCSMSYSTTGQIGLTNPSFEDTPADATMPSGWWLVEPGTTPDILPGYWGVYEDASEGDTFIGLITRDDGSFEAIGQRLPYTLNQDVCYQFNLDLAHSEEYVGYNTPIYLRVYIGKSKKKRGQLIYTSPLLESEDWMTESIQFIPSANSRYLIIEAYSPQPTPGNLLLDNISTINKCNRA